MSQVVSIIMPAYNAERFIAEAIESVLNQVHKEWELIIVNDGSTDGTTDVVQKYLLEDRIILINQANKGVSAARNEGLLVMKGDYFCFLDADDQLTEVSLSSRLLAFGPNSISFVDGFVASFDEMMSNQTGIFKPNFKGNPLPELLKLSSSCFFGITWMIKRDRSINYKFPLDMDFAEDLWFFINLSITGGVYTYVEEVIYKRREVPGSTMSNLKGLAKGYWNLYHKIVQNGISGKTELKSIRYKIRKLIFKMSIKRSRFELLWHLIEPSK